MMNDTLRTTTEEQKDTPSGANVAAMVGLDMPAAPAGWEDRGPLPYFRGRTFEDHVSEWRLVDREAQASTWKLAAIAASLERSSGGRPRGEKERVRTAIQRFCDTVN